MPGPGLPFAADPSRQVARMDGGQLRSLVEGAAYLFANEYETALIMSKTGWTSQDLLDRVGVQVTTLGGKGALVEVAGSPSVHVPVPPEENRDDPTGVGDAFRAGFLAALSFGLGLERCAQVGSLLATYALESVGTQEYDISPAAFLARFTTAYGEAAGADLAPHLPA